MKTAFTLGVMLLLVLAANQSFVLRGAAGEAELVTSEWIGGERCLTNVALCEELWDKVPQPCFVTYRCVIDGRAMYAGNIPPSH